jgi:hypothetical protein
VFVIVFYFRRAVHTPPEQVSKTVSGTVYSISFS